MSLPFIQAQRELCETFLRRLDDEHDGDDAFNCFMEATECLFWNCRKQMELEAMKKQRREREAFQDVMGEKEQDGKVMTNQKFGKDAFISKDELLGHVTGFIRNKRKRINLSNREEFLVFSDQDNTCARTGASYINRSIQMKHDKATHDDGPLSRSIKEPQQSNASIENAAIESRLKEVTRHLGIRFNFVKNAISLEERLKIVEEKIMELEETFPPWSDVHLYHVLESEDPGDWRSQMPALLTTYVESNSGKLVKEQTVQLPTASASGDVEFQPHQVAFNSF